MKKEIWIHIDSYRPNGNAPANRAYAFACFMSEKGIKVNIITIGKKDEIVHRPEATVYYIGNKFHFKTKNIINRLMDNIVFSRKTSQLLSKNKNEIKNAFFMVSIPEYIAGLSCLKAKRYGAKIIVDVRDIWPDVAVEMGSFKRRSLKTFLFNRIANKYYKKADYVFGVSRLKVERLKQKVPSFKKQNVFWIGNGFDLNSLTAIDDDSILNNIDCKNKFIISYIGNVGKAQHIASLVKCAEFDEKKNRLFIISGGGSELKTIEKEIQRKQLKNIILTGPVSKEQANAILKISNISYVPLLSDKMLDSVPTKLFEALGFGVPTLLVAKGESSEILNATKLGISIEPSKIDKLESALNDFEMKYDEIIKHKDDAMRYIHENYSRQKYCKDFYHVIFESNDIER